MRYYDNRTPGGRVESFSAPVAAPEVLEGEILEKSTAVAVAAGETALLRGVDPAAFSVFVDDLLDNTPEWQELALCSQIDPELFFPEKGGSTREARSVCNRCEVKANCLEYALGNNEHFGVWGGLTERGRNKLKRHAA